MVMEEGESPAHLLSWSCLIFHAVSSGTPGGPTLSSTDHAWSCPFLAFDQTKILVQVSLDKEDWSCPCQSLLWLFSELSIIYQHPV